MIDNDERRALINSEHLRLLGLTYYVSAAMTAFFSLFGLFYMAMGLIVGTVGHTTPARGAGPPLEVGYIFALIGAGIFLFAVAVASAKVYVARCLDRRRQRIPCLVVAALSCLEIPYGTALGVCTFIVLARPEVKAQFDGAHPA